jgi:hypothetical protein
MNDLPGADLTRIARFEPDATATIVAETSDAGDLDERRQPSGRWRSPCSAPGAPRAACKPSSRRRGRRRIVTSDPPLLPAA